MRARAWSRVARTPARRARVDATTGRATTVEVGAAESVARASSVASAVRGREDVTARSMLEANGRRFDVGAAGGRALEALLLARSDDLRCVDVMCQHVGDACACRLARTLDKRGLDLRVLDVSGNRLRALPSVIWGLRRLEWLDVSDNALTLRDVPFDDLIANSSEMAPSLKNLNLRGNVDLVDALGDRWREVVDAMAKRGVRLLL